MVLSEKIVQIVPPGTELPPEGICQLEKNLIKNKFLNRPYQS